MYDVCIHVYSSPTFWVLEWLHATISSSHRVTFAPIWSDSGLLFSESGQRTQNVAEDICVCVLPSLLNSMLSLRRMDPIYVCLCLCIYVCAYGSHVRIFVSMYICMCISIPCKYICVYVYMYVHMGPTYVYLCLCIYVCAHVFMLVVYTHIYTGRNTKYKVQSSSLDIHTYTQETYINTLKRLDIHTYLCIRT
jgi:hypothetical protein